MKVLHVVCERFESHKLKHSDSGTFTSMQFFLPLSEVSAGFVTYSSALCKLGEGTSDLLPSLQVHDKKKKKEEPTQTAFTFQRGKKCPVRPLNGVVVPQFHHCVESASFTARR